MLYRVVRGNEEPPAGVYKGRMRSEELHTRVTFLFPTGHRHFRMLSENSAYVIRGSSGGCSCSVLFRAMCVLSWLRRFPWTG